MRRLQTLTRRPHRLLLAREVALSLDREGET